MKEMLDTEDIKKEVEGLGFERIEFLPGSTYQDNSTIIIIPTRGMIHYKVMQSIQNMITPMNQKRAIMFAVGHEVGRAYDELINNILTNQELSKWKYVLTLEDDNLIPCDAHVRLLETINWGGFDAVGGLYFTKGDINMPMCYGDPQTYTQTGVLDFKPLNIVDAVTKGQIVECNGLAMGCTLYKLDLFRELPAPWFVTVNDLIPDKGAQCFTQDLYFAERAKKMGKRFAVDTRVHVGHLDINTGIVY